MNPTYSSTRRGILSSEVLKSLVAGGEPMNGIAYAKSQAYSDTTVGVLKAMAEILTTENAEPLLRAFYTDFAECLRGLTITGRLANLHRVPFLVRMIAQSAGTSAHWTGEKRPKAVTRAEFTGEYLGVTKVTGIGVVTSEVARSSAPAAQGAVLRDLVRAIATAKDQAFIDCSNGGISGIRPASITFNAPQFPSTADTIDNLRADLTLVIKSLIAGGSDMANAIWVTHPGLAAHFAAMNDSSQIFSSINAKGGFLMGFPVLTSANVPVDDTTGGPTTSITLLDASQIAIADDDESSVSVSTEAAIQMDSDPSTGATEQVPLWQMGLVGLRAERTINFKPRHPGMVATLTAVRY